ncbi:MAG: cbb3-type cytochrome c oxidase subunit I [Planctomycetes bacterium]|nr:cbb3-type cytochrome c oxidase subunit I [Planctomycetota bacterium]
MSSLHPSVAVAAPAIPDDPGTANYLTHEKGILSWLGTLDHKRICVMYLYGIIAFFLIAGAFALLFRTALLFPQKGAVPGGIQFLISHDMYNQLFTLHGAIMIFVVIIPGIPAALGNFIVPLMLGAKDVAFPRLNLASWYMWAFGCVWLLIALLTGGLDTGWTFYTPYSTSTSTRVIPALTGAFLLGFSSIFTGLNFIVTIHKLRPPQMGWFQMPLVLWSLYSTAIMQVLATPVLGITLLMLIVEKAVGIGIFTPELGGDPVLFQHFFWFYSHPAVYIMILPAMGVMSELLATFSRKHIFGYTFIAFSSVAIALLSFLVWGHHMFVSGQSSLLGTIFSAITFSIAVPSAVKVFNWVATLYQGSIEFKAPMVYALSFIWIFGIGGLTGLFLSTMSTNVHLTDTYFVVAHFHMVMAATIFVFLGGLHYWWPKITGRMYNETLALAGCLISVIGFNITFLSQFPMGSNGMMRRYYNYAPEFQSLHVISTIGSYLAGVGFFVSVVCLVQSLFRGRKAPANPWGAATMEWRTPSPPPWYNFETTPKVEDPYDYDLLKYNERTDSYDYVGRPAGAPRPAH